MVLLLVILIVIMSTSNVVYFILLCDLNCFTTKDGSGNSVVNCLARDLKVASSILAHSSLT